MKLKLPLHTPSWKELEKWLVFLLLLLFPKGVVLPSPILAKAVTLSAYLITAFLFLRYWRRILYVFTRDITLLLILGLAVASITWSAVPGVSLAYVRSLLNTSILAAYIVACYKPREQMQLWAGIFIVWGMLSLLVEIAFPSYGVNREFWTGIFSFKNWLGIPMVLGAMLALSNILNRGKHRLFSILCIFIALVLILLSESKTSLLALVSALLPLPLYIFSKQSHYKFRVILYAFALLLGIGLAVLTFLNIETIIIAWLGKDLTLTGRWPLWEAIIQQGLERPWLGYGQGAFWHTEESLNAIAKNTWPVLPSTGAYLTNFHSHNGFIEIFLSLGFFGILTFAINLFLVLSRVIFLVFSTKTIESFWMLQILAVVIVINASEAGTLIVGAHLLWILYVTVALSSAVQCKSLN